MPTARSLRRTAIGDLRVPDDGPEEISVEELMAFLPERELTESEAKAVSHGIPVPRGQVLHRTMLACRT